MLPGLNAGSQTGNGLRLVTGRRIIGMKNKRTGHNQLGGNAVPAGPAPTAGNRKIQTAAAPAGR